VRIYRQHEGRKWPPAKKDGLFVLGDPRAHAQKHHEKNEVLVRTEDEAIRLLREGFSIRVETSTRPSLVRLNLFVYGEPLSHS
jgi:hypothetical protein